ncbi:MAG: 1,4-beta-xylanase, partial [Blautia sp.]|nr:1,4-beta-xylanase [Blautia sp.]
WKLEASEDGRQWFLLEDKTQAGTDLSHDFLVWEEGFEARYLRLSDIAVPYEQAPCISGLRVFGRGDGVKPAMASFTVSRVGDVDMQVDIHPQQDAVGYTILFGHSPDKLYHSYMVFSSGEKRIGALIAGRGYFVRVDAFNENGITHGDCLAL